MDLPNPLGLRDTKLLETAFHRYTVIEQQRPHRAIAADDSRFEFVQQIHLFIGYGGQIAKTRAGNPEPPFGFGNVATISAPLSGT